MSEDLWTDTEIDDLNHSRRAGSSDPTTSTAPAAPGTSAAHCGGSSWCFRSCAARTS